MARNKWRNASLDLGINQTDFYKKNSAMARNKWGKVSSDLGIIQTDFYKTNSVMTRNKWGNASLAVKYLLRPVHALLPRPVA